MDANETKSAAKFYAKLYPGKVTSEMGRMLARELLPFGVNETKAAMQSMAASSEWPNPPALMSKLRESQRRTHADSPARKALSCWEVYRRESKHLAGKCDVEVSLRVHRAWWFDGRCSRTEGYRNQFATSCRVQLIHAKVTPETLDGLIAAVFDPNVGYFKQVLEEVRALYPTVTETDEAARSTEQTELEVYM